jgi:NADPH:quinone reductase-like Zn-dependent oxidoreductase
VNPIDCKIRAGTYDDAPGIRSTSPPDQNIILITGEDYYDSAPKGFHILGYDGAGTVLEVGPDCTSVKPGDDVSYVGATTRHGSYAEYQLVSEFQCALKSKSLDFVQAASYGLTFGTAYQSLYDRLEIKPDENVGILIVSEKFVLAGSSPVITIALHWTTTDLSSCKPDQWRRRSR